MDPLYRYKYDLLMTIEEIHGWTTNPARFPSEKQVIAKTTWLAARLSNWRKQANFEEYADLTNQLAQSTLQSFRDSSSFPKDQALSLQLETLGVTKK